MVRIKRQQMRKQVKTIDTILMERELRSNKNNYIDAIRNIGLFLFKKCWGRSQWFSRYTHVINYKSAAFYEMKSTASPNFISGPKSKSQEIRATFLFKIIADKLQLTTRL
jgi:hypothetical protein